MVYEERRHDRDEMQHTGGELMLNDDTILLLSRGVPVSSNVYCNGKYLLGKVSLQALCLDSRSICRLLT